MEEGRARFRAALVQRFAGCDRPQGPGRSTDHQGGPPRAPLAPGCIRGTAALAPAPLLPLSMGWRPQLILFPGASPLPDKTRVGLGCQAPRSQQFPFYQVPRDRHPGLIPANTVITQGGYTGERLSLRTTRLIGICFTDSRATEVRILSHPLLHPRLMAEFPPQ